MGQRTPWPPTKWSLKGRCCPSNIDFGFISVYTGRKWSRPIVRPNRCVVGEKMIGVSADDQAVDDQLVELELYELTSGHQLLDPKSCPTGVGVSSHEEYYSQFLGLYILKMDLLNAKFLWKRIPTPVKEASASLKMLWNLGKLLLRKNYSKFFETAAQIIQQPNNPESLVYIITQIGQRQQHHLVGLIESAYSCISVEFVASLFCIPMNDVINLFVTRNWELTADGNYLSLTQPPPAVESGVQATNEQIMSKLSEFMSFIENH